MSSMEGAKWQLILADLALILFLVSLSALATSSPKAETRETIREPEIATAQAIYRSEEGGTSLREWLGSQVLDPRATLTIFARHRSADRTEIWARAEALADEARSTGARVRVVISPGEDSDIYASFAFDDLEQLPLD